jgi:hypothetical protein
LRDLGFDRTLNRVRVSADLVLWPEVPLVQRFLELVAADGMVHEGAVVLAGVMNSARRSGCSHPGNVSTGLPAR